MPNEFFLPIDGGQVKKLTRPMVETLEVKFPFMDVQGEIERLIASGASERWQSSQWFFKLVAWLGKKNRENGEAR